MRRAGRRAVAAAAVCALAGLTAACRDDAAVGAFAAAGVAARPLPAMAATRLDPADLGGRKRLRYGATPFLGDEGTREAFEAIAEALTERLAVPVDFVVARSYQELIDLAVRGELEIMQLSPLSYIKASEQMPNLRLIAASTSFGTDSYSAFLVVRSDSPLQELADLRPAARAGGPRVRVALVDPNSASGFLLPTLALREHGIDPERDVDVQFLGSHEATVAAVQDGRADVAAVSSGTLNSARRGEVIGPGNLRLLYKAGRLPYDAVCVSPRLSDDVARRIAGAFAALDTRSEQGRRALRRSYGMTGWIAPDPSRYDRLRTSWGRARTLRWRQWARELPLADAPTSTAPAPLGAGAKGAEVER